VICPTAEAPRARRGAFEMLSISIQQKKLLTYFVNSLTNPVSWFEFTNRFDFQ
jgi:hypothetical protein